MNYYIRIATPNKAKADIDDIVEGLGYTNLAHKDYGRGGVGRFLTKLCAVSRILWTLRKDDVLFLQYPMKKFYKAACTLAHWRGAKTIAVIHDLGAFRRHKLTAEQENRRLAKTDFIICHNDIMADYLRSHGYHGSLHSLGIFDYLSKQPVNAQHSTLNTQHSTFKVVYAGNLGMWRNEFLYHLNGVANTWTLDLYGKGFDETKNTCKNLKYHGFINSDDFIANVRADFGLVWDGASVDECDGAWGEYLKINNPHKTSFYLRAGIPVIVWKKAAMAPFVEKHGIGIAIDSIRELDSRLNELDADGYKTMADNAATMGKRLADGFYIKTGLEAAHAHLSQQ